AAPHHLADDADGHLAARGGGHEGAQAPGRNREEKLVILPAGDPEVQPLLAHPGEVRMQGQALALEDGADAAALAEMKETLQQAVGEIDGGARIAPDDGPQLQPRLGEELPPLGLAESPPPPREQAPQPQRRAAELARDDEKVARSSAFAPQRMGGACLAQRR